MTRKICMLCDWARPEPRYLRLYCWKKQAIVASEDSCPDWRDEWPKPDINIKSGTQTKGT